MLLFILSLYFFFDVHAVIIVTNNIEDVAGIRVYSTKVCFEKTIIDVFGFVFEFENYLYS